ncbi:MAG: hypothetical protein SGJ24_05085 [Chloroflexota bacterium]|nr:hypothetical protein [Chloroflexota bacterium]
MANRSQDENITLLTDALRHAGTRGLSIDQARIVVFGKDTTAGSKTKKLLERLKSKGVVHTEMGIGGIVFLINQGQ